MFLRFFCPKAHIKVFIRWFLAKVPVWGVCKGVSEPKVQDEVFSRGNLSGRV